MWKYDIWKEGKYIDLWSLNHVLSGGVLAGLLIFIGLPFWVSFLAALSLILGWEIYEIVKGIEEPIGNKIMDVVTGILGFIVMYPLFMKMDEISRIIIFAIISTIFLFLELWGFIAYKKVNR